MPIDPLAVLVINVLGKYVIDQGATLVKEAGQAAAQAAYQLAEFVLTRLRADPADAKNVKGFEEDPKGYQVPVADAVAEKMKSDPEFATQLLTLLEEYKKATSSSGATNINASSGVVATQSGVAAGPGGVAVAGNVQGEITITNTQSSYTSQGTDP